MSTAHDSIKELVKLGLLLAAAGCSTGTLQGSSGHTTPDQARFAGACPLGVPRAHVVVEDTSDGVALTFTASPEQLDDLRLRARHAAAMHGPGAHLGPGHAGAHNDGGEHGLQAMQLPPAHATVTDVDGGTRIALVPSDAVDRDALVEKVHERGQRMNILACR
jgi:hypothetical protein